jgi:hypothetical protein
MWRSLPIRHRPALATLAMMGLGVASAPAFALLYTVNTTSDSGHDIDPGNGRCETVAATRQCTLRGAIEEANARAGIDDIDFKIPTTDPRYNPQTGQYSILLGASLPAITSSTNISGLGVKRLTINMNPFNVGRIFDVNTSGTVNITNLTIDRGVTPLNESGAGIRNQSTGTVTVTNCVLSRNRSDRGGAIYNSAAGTVIVTSSTFQANLATRPASGTGGAIYNGGTLTVVNSIFEENNSAWSGGGIFNSNGLVTVTASTFRGNGTLQFGGAIGSLGGNVSVTNSTFYANVAHGHDANTIYGLGGAIGNEEGTVHLTNSTLTANFSALGGGGVSNGIDGHVSIKSSLIAQNYDGHGANPDVAGTFSSQGFNLIGKTDGSSGFIAATDRKGTIAAPLNPGFDPKGLRSNGGPTQTVALTANSAAVDRGSSAALTGMLTTDQRGAGFPRTVNRAPANAAGGDGTDIGAFELQ